jgi:hypothetical protein
MGTMVKNIQKPLAFIQKYINKIIDIKLHPVNNNVKPLDHIYKMSAKETAFELKKSICNLKKLREKYLEEVVLLRDCRNDLISLIIQEHHFFKSEYMILSYKKNKLRVWIKHSLEILNIINKKLEKFNNPNDKTFEYLKNFSDDKKQKTFEIFDENFKETDCLFEMHNTNYEIEYDKIYIADLWVENKRYYKKIKDFVNKEVDALDIAS